MDHIVTIIAESTSGTCTSQAAGLSLRHAFERASARLKTSDHVERIDADIGGMVRSFSETSEFLAATEEEAQPKNTSITLPAYLVDIIDRRRRSRGVSRSDWIREVLIENLEVGT